MPRLRCLRAVGIASIDDVLDACGLYARYRYFLHRLSPNSFTMTLVAIAKSPRQFRGARPKKNWERERRGQAYRPNLRRATIGGTAKTTPPPLAKLQQSSPDPWPAVVVSGKVKPKSQRPGRCKTVKGQEEVKEMWCGQWTRCYQLTLGWLPCRTPL